MLNTKLSVGNTEMSLDIYLNTNNNRNDTVFTDENTIQIAKKAMLWIIKVSLQIRILVPELYNKSRIWISPIQLVKKLYQFE